MVEDHVVPHGFVKAPPSRPAILTCWLVDVVLAGALGFGAVIVSVFLLAPFGPHRAGGSGLHQLRPWATLVAIGAGVVAATLIMSLGAGGRSAGHALAELRVDGPGGHAAGPGRRLARSALIVATFCALAWWNVIAAAAVVVALWLPTLIRPDRRGPYELASGLVDYAVELGTPNG